MGWESWGELGVEDGAVLKAQWCSYAFLASDTIRGGVEKWCNLGTWECARLEYGDVVDQVTNMNRIFMNQGDSNEDISGWDVANATTMRSMFSSASTFNQPLGALNVSNVADISIMHNIMFSRASSFNQPLGAWNVSNDTNMNGTPPERINGR